MSKTSLNEDRCGITGKAAGDRRESQRGMKEK